MYNLGEFSIRRFHLEKILFQGDSITDAERIRTSVNVPGIGYAALVSAELGLDFPGEYKFFNRGISGNRVIDLYARNVMDIFYIKPDYMSILIGVNDIWHGLDFNNGTGIKRFEKIYDILLDEIAEELPNTKVMILEPFILRGSNTDNTEADPNRFEKFSSGVYEVAGIAKKLAEKHNLKFIPLQDKFEKACEKASPDYWLSDGVHPTTKGHELIKREWIKAFNEIK